MSSISCLGFFALARGARSSVIKRATNKPTTYAFYDTTIQCTSGDPIPAQIRIYSPNGDVVHPDSTVVFLFAKVFAPPQGPILLEAKWAHPFPSNPNDDGYDDAIPDALYPTFFCLVTVPETYSTYP
jgi:hypothetical protein